MKRLIDEVSRLMANHPDRPRLPLVHPENETILFTARCRHCKDMYGKHSRWLHWVDLGEYPRCADDANTFSIEL